jgi:hypothetical protein
MLRLIYFNFHRDQERRVLSNLWALWLPFGFLCSLCAGSESCLQSRYYLKHFEIYHILYGITHISKKVNCLFQQSEAVERAMYGCKWFNASQRFKKYTQFIIMRSQKSVRLSAGNFFAVSLEGFAGVRIYISSKLDKSVKFPECLTICWLTFQANCCWASPAQWFFVTSPTALGAFRQLPSSTECILNNIQNSVRISQETHYVSATKTNRLMQFREKLLFIVRTIRNTNIKYGQNAEVLVR